jgi:cyclopropane-fatty-acyl-phospholipid synthase
MIYSCALWDGASSLADAQQAKLRYHIAAARAAGAERVLDVGCGWGGLLRALVASGTRHAVGLTLSANQAASIDQFATTGIELRQEHWKAHSTSAPYDAVISIGAFEHFASPAHEPSEKLAIYRDFFATCRRWLKPGRRLSLQTIAYGRLRPEQANAFMQREIFPDSELPLLEEIVVSTKDIFELISLRNDSSDYAKTCEAWLQNLRNAKSAAIAASSREVYARYEHYLKLCSVGFRSGQLNLLRLVFAAYPLPMHARTLQDVKS